MQGSAAMTPPRSSPGTAPLNFFSENVDAWGAAEWFDRLATAIRQQDAAVVANDDAAMEICRNVAASSAMRLVRDFEQQVRSALRGPAQAAPCATPQEVQEACAQVADRAAKRCVREQIPGDSVAAFIAKAIRALIPPATSVSSTHERAVEDVHATPSCGRRGGSCACTQATECVHEGGK
jgi:hypothetical protein